MLFSYRLPRSPSAHPSRPATKGACSNIPSGCICTNFSVGELLLHKLNFLNSLMKQRQSASTHGHVTSQLCAWYTHVGNQISFICSGRNLKRHVITPGSHSPDIRFRETNHFFLVEASRSIQCHPLFWQPEVGRIMDNLLPGCVRSGLHRLTKIHHSSQQTRTVGLCCQYVLPTKTQNLTSKVTARVIYPSLGLGVKPFLG